MVIYIIILYVNATSIGVSTDGSIYKLLWLPQTVSCLISPFPRAILPKIPSPVAMDKYAQCTHTYAYTNI